MPGTGSPSLLLAFWAGIVSFVSPCVLPLVPGYLAAVSGTQPGQGRGLDARVLARSLLFVATFSALLRSPKFDSSLRTKRSLPCGLTARYLMWRRASFGDS